MTGFVEDEVVAEGEFIFMVASTLERTKGAGKEEAEK